MLHIVDIGNANNYFSLAVIALSFLFILFIDLLVSLLTVCDLSIDRSHFDHGNWTSQEL